MFFVLCERWFRLLFSPSLLYISPLRPILPLQFSIETHQYGAKNRCKPKRETMGRRKKSRPYFDTSKSIISNKISKKSIVFLFDFEDFECRCFSSFLHSVCNKITVVNHSVSRTSNIARVARSSRELLYHVNVRITHTTYYILFRDHYSSSLYLLHAHNVE